MVCLSRDYDRRIAEKIERRAAATIIESISVQVNYSGALRLDRGIHIDLKVLSRAAARIEEMQDHNWRKLGVLLSKFRIGPMFISQCYERLFGNVKGFGRTLICSNHRPQYPEIARHIRDQSDESGERDPKRRYFAAFLCIIVNLWMAHWGWWQVTFEPGHKGAIGLRINGPR